MSLESSNTYKATMFDGAGKEVPLPSGKKAVTNHEEMLAGLDRLKLGETRKRKHVDELFLMGVTEIERGPCKLQIVVRSGFMFIDGRPNS